MRLRFKSILLIISFLLIGSLTLGGFYISYGHITSSDPFVKVSGPLSINFATGNHVKINKNAQSEIAIINDSNEDAYYYIEFKNIKNAQKAKYKVTNNNDINIESELLPFNTIVSSYILIKAGESQNFNFEFISGSEEEFSLDIDVNMETLESSSFADVIIKNNEIKKEPLTKIGEEVASEDEGLIEGLDDFGPTYYFRGNVQNNYVLINDLLFRIVRINGDGSIKLVLNDNLDLLSNYYEDSYDINNTIIINKLNNWLLSSVKEYNNIIATQKYCNDLTQSNNNFLASDRITINNIPTFYCLGDTFASKVGLLTADEVIYAGGVYGMENNNYYLYNENLSSYTFTMTSSSLDNDGLYHVFALASDGSLTSIVGTSAGGVRPVITINKTTSVKEGDGSVNNPYILEKN